jgi:dihydrofolate synthase/folylpolyglutamate synthase
MNQFKSIKSAIDWIESVKRFGEKLDLTRMEKASELLNHPERKFKTIHITGTNGKGSTSNYTMNILKLHGLKVGLFVSPFIMEFNERIQINGVNISNKDLLKYINQIYKVYLKMIETFNEVVTFFELLTLVSMLYFKDKHVDIAIYEVGIGGSLDATNIISPITVGITNIGYDHQNVLGKTLEEILDNKLGIVKKDIQLVTCIQQDHLVKRTKEYCTKQGTTMLHLKESVLNNLELMPNRTRFDYHNQSFELSMTGKHQAMNAIMAYEIASYTIMHLSKVFVPEKALKALKNAYWPGRFEIINNIILDGAHNLDGIKSLIETVNTLYPKKKKHVIFTMFQDKDIELAIPMIDELADFLYITELKYARGLNAERIYQLSSHNDKVLNKDIVSVFNDVNQLISEDEILIVTGSLYLVSKIKRIMSKDLYLKE